MKIYKVIYSSVYIEGGENTVDVKVFLNKDVDGRSMEDSVSIYLEEDESYDEIELQEEKLRQQKEEKEYEM